MTSDRGNPLAPDALDDEALAQLVRDVAGEWVMPPVRLDAASWRDRVRTGRGRRIAGIRTGFGRIGQALTAAVALTVVGALLAVVLTRPPAQPGKSPEPSSGRTPNATSRAQASPLPKLLVNGELPDPVDLVVQTEQGDFAQVHLASGAIGSALTGSRYGSALRIEPSGAMLCLCLSESMWVGDSPTEATVALNRYDAAGKLVSSTPIESFAGEPDPRDASRFVPERPPHVLTALASSDDGRYGFVGWSFRAHPAWKSGILVVDLADGSVIDRLDLPDASTGDAETRRVTDAPRVVGTTASGGALIARSWFSWTPVTSQNASYTFDSEAFTATFADGRFSDASALGNVEDCGERILRGGSTSGGGTWLACSSGGSYQTVVRRFAPDGSILGDTRVAGLSGIEGDLTALSPDGAKLFLWNPMTALLTRVDLATGETATSQGPIPAAAGTNPLTALGDWLAPAAAAKSFLRGGVILSPDGSTVYAIGVRAVSGGPDSSGSTGVFVFDAESLASTGHWQPTADFVSLAMSRDGRFLYAAGLPGVDADGQGNASMAASITVFDTSDGSRRLIAGLLGREMLSFGSSILD
jgi:hypothetical protein